MKYDFDSLIDRKNTNSVKWDVGENELPMWIADMDFKTAPAVEEAIVKRAAHGIYGYADLPDSWYDAYVGWWKNRHGLTIEKNQLIFCTGVVPAISSAVRKLTTPAEKVVVISPVYNIFFNSILNNGRVPLESGLVFDGENYNIDFDDLESKLSDPQTSMLIFCNPHNPVGRIWTKDEIRKVGLLCKRYGVTVISDEIHCDLTDPGCDYVPFASASEVCRDISITCVAPTKTFNIAGLQTAAVFASNEFLRHKIWRALNTGEVAEPNVFAVDAAVAAFTKSADWLDELRVYLAENKKTVRDFIGREIPEIKVMPSQATYLLWLDCRKLGSSEYVADSIRKKTGLFLSAGGHYRGDGDFFLRMNIACPRLTVSDGLSRLKRAVYEMTKDNK